MQPVFAQLRRRLTSIADFFVGRLVLLKPQAPGNPITKNVSILRIDYPQSEVVLSRVWEIATSRSS